MGLNLIAGLTSAAEETAVLSPAESALTPVENVTNAIGGYLR